MTNRYESYIILLPFEWKENAICRGSFLSWIGFHALPGQKNCREAILSC